MHLPDPGIKPGSPALQAGALPPELSGKPSKSLQMINAGEGVEKRDTCYTVSENVSWWSHYGEQYGSFLKKLKIELMFSCFKVVSDSLRPYGLELTRLPFPGDFPGKNIGVGCHFLCQGIFLTLASNPHLLCLLDSTPLSHLGSQK